MVVLGTSLDRIGLERPSAPATVEILDAAQPRDRSRWLELWSSWPQREVMAHPDYTRLFARPGDRALAATLRTATGGVLYPFIVRPIAAEPWAPAGARSCDLTTPYGYGGPFAWALTPADAQTFWTGFDQWAAQHQVASSFARLSLFPGQLLPFNGPTVTHGPNVVRSLDLAPDELWKDYERGARRDIKEAWDRGVQIEFDPEGRRLGDFQEIYTATMKRRGATPGYYFPQSFFESMIRDLAGHLTFVHATAGGKVVASELVLLSADHAYSFLGGTLASALPWGTASLLKHELFRWCRERGMKAVVLGGGYQPDDGILRFKRRFGRAAEVPFQLGLKTCDVEESRRLVERRRQWEREQGRDWTPASSYFPEYRS
jgi:hypothetical protein